jgi:hypothetical protein
MMGTRSNINALSKAAGKPLSNQLLAALGPESRSRIDPHLQPVTLKLGAVVCEAGGLLKHAYFPRGSVLSLLTVLENGSAIETANIGREGAFGLFAAMYSRVSFNRCIVQLEGRMVRCPIELLQLEFKNSEHVRNLFVSYSETLLSQVQQAERANQPELKVIFRDLARAWRNAAHDIVNNRPRLLRLAVDGERK